MLGLLLLDQPEVWQAVISCGLRCRYQILIDGEEKKSGSIFEDFTPAFNPDAEIDDPEDEKPDDWVDTPK